MPPFAQRFHGIEAHKHLRLLRSVFALATSVLSVTVFQVAAQEQPGALPNVLRIYREEIKQGKGAAHENTEAAFAKLYAKYKVPANYLGFTRTAGPSEAWFLEAHDSIKSIQDTDAFIEKSRARVETTKWDSMDGELRLNSRSFIAVLHPEVTYRADQFMQELPKTRYFGITMMRVKPYMDMQFWKRANSLSPRIKGQASNNRLRFIRLCRAERLELISSSRP